MDGQLQALDAHSVGLLRSGVYLPSFTHALQALLEIAISSGANTISGSIDPAVGAICVDDNGVGLDTRLVNLFGRFDSNALVSSRSTTQSSGAQIPSYLSLPQHRVLDSLAHLSLLDICSRHADASYTHQTLFREGKVIFSAPAKTSRRHNHGTTTTVRDLFHNLPVRQIRENDPARHQQRLKRQWEEARLALQSLAIVYPHITFILRNSSHQTLAAPNSTGSFYRLSKTGLSSSTFGKIFGQQFVLDSIPLDVSMDGLQVTGLFSRKRHSSRAIQLIYLDRVLITSDSLVHRGLASLFAGQLSQDTSRSSAARTSQGTKTNSAPKNGASSVDRHPVYLLLFTSLPNPTRPDHDFVADFLDEKEQYLVPQTEEKMNRIASRIFSQAFPPVKHALSASSIDQKPQQDSAVKRTLQSRWPVTKRPRLSPPNSPTRPSAPQSISLTDRFSAPPKKHINRSPHKTVQHKACVPKTNLRIGGDKTNPKNSAGCSAHAQSIKSSATSSGQPASLHSMIPDLKSRFAYKPSSDSTHVNSTAMDGEIESHSPQPSFHPECGKKRSHSHKFDGVTIENADAEFRIDLAQLADASKFAVIGQLDKKFIIAKIDGHCRPDHGPEDGLIVAFDQHAVHERIRIERFLQDVCSGTFAVKELNPQNKHPEDQTQAPESGIHPGNSVPILVNRNEFDGLLKFKKLFGRWGFIYEQTLTGSASVDEARGEEEEDDGGPKQIFMRAVPELIWPRVQCTDGQFECLKTILRGCLGFFEDRFRDHNLRLIDHHAILPDPHRDWFASVKDCPAVLVHLLNSKACRGSIMFGDKLTPSESRKLLTELGRARLPFSCAHGRPTCYPLYKFGQPSDVASRRGDAPAAHRPHPPSQQLPLSQPSPAHSPPLSRRHSPFTPADSFQCRKIHWESLLSG
ncbi:hypothetical protein PtB15_6B664 [Puccinia triticina]|nr:hypothetical protein PtB15_6B664 [Puccinia triticina]